MFKINRQWHILNKMPHKATIEQRIEWHINHYKNCSCTPIPKKIKEEMEKMGVISN